MPISTAARSRPHIKRYKDIIGRVYGMLTIIEHSGTRTLEFTDKWGYPLLKSYSLWLAKCECGETVEVMPHILRRHGRHCGSKTCKMIMVNRNRKEKIENERLGIRPTTQTPWKEGNISFNKETEKGNTQTIHI